MDGNKINRQNEGKYLGVFLDARLTWIKNTNYMSNKAKAGLSKVYRLIDKKSRLKTNLKLLLYKTIIRPVITYAPPVWMNAARRHYTKLQRIQNRTLRIIYHPERKTKNTHKLANIKTLQDYNKALITNFTEKLNKIPNKLINKIGKYSNYERLKLRNQSGRKHRNKLISLPNRTNIQVSPIRNV